MERRLVGYNPKKLSPVAWSYARGPVLNRVRECRPRVWFTARNMLTLLINFLAITPFWDRTSPFEMDDVLTPAAIEEHARMRGPVVTRPAKETQELTRLMRQLPPCVPTVRSRKATERATLHIAQLRRQTLDAPDFAVPDSHPSPTGETTTRPARAPVLAGPRLPRSVRVWRSLLPAAPEVGATMPDAQRNAPQPRKGGKRLSQKAAVAEAKRRHETAMAALQNAGPAPLPTLPVDMLNSIDKYHPQWKYGDAAWQQIAEVCRLLTKYYAPKSHNARTSAMWHLSRFLRWVALQPHRVDVTAPLRLDELDTPGLVRRHLETAVEPSNTLESRRSVLNTALLHLHGGSHTRMVQDRSPSKPHGQVEVDVLLQYAHHQKTPTNRRSMCFIVGLSLGAGLDAHDLSLVRRRHLEKQELAGGGDVLTVRVIDDGEERVVVVAEVMRPTVELAMRMHDGAGRGPHAYILGTESSRDGVVQKCIERATASYARDRPYVSCRRMRNTWIVAAMEARVPVRELLDAAGLKYATTLEQLMRYCTPLSETYLSELFANMHYSWR
jgi:hypothetical protein